MSILEQERFQFAQETVKAEAWLKAKEPLIASKVAEGGEAQAQTDEVEQLILRHEAFRKAAVTWKERFSSLRQLSAVSSASDKCLITVVKSQFCTAADGDLVCAGSLLWHIVCEISFYWNLHFILFELMKTFI